MYSEIWKEAVFLVRRVGALKQTSSSKFGDINDPPRVGDERDW